jgi:hypothetical protein
MKLSASLIAMSISALRSGRVQDAAELFSQAAHADDAPELIATLVDNNEVACSLSSAILAPESELGDVIDSLSSELSRAGRLSKMSDPLEDILSVADDDSDDDDQIDLGVIDFEDEDEEADDSFESESSDVQRSLIKLTISNID